MIRKGPTLRSIRKTHRYLGLVAGVQLLFWTVSGLYFSLNPIAQVRGEDLIRPSTPVNLAGIDLVSPQIVITTLIKQVPGIESVPTLTLRSFLELPVYEVTYQRLGEKHYALADARDGTLRLPLTQAEAITVAQQDFLPAAPIQTVEYLTSVPADSEYREQPLPAYRIIFDHPSLTRLYVSTERGLVTARRNDTWRWFDWFWMLHVMDYQTRDNFNHWLLQFFSLLGVATVLSGFTLWGTTSRFTRKRSAILIPKNKGMS